MSEDAFTAVRDRMTLMCTCFRGRRYWRWNPTMRVLHKRRAPTARGPCERRGQRSMRASPSGSTEGTRLGRPWTFDLERGAPDRLPGPERLFRLLHPTLQPAAGTNELQLTN